LRLYYKFKWCANIPQHRDSREQKIRKVKKRKENEKEWNDDIID